MRLYHFCAAAFLEKIKREGLTLGATPVQVSGRLFLVPKTQWLTVRAEFDQYWNGMVTLPYDRTAYRIEVKVPHDRARDLLDWATLKGRLQKIHGANCILTDFDVPEAHPEDWRIYLGHIKPQWLRKVVANPHPVESRIQGLEIGVE